MGSSPTEATGITHGPWPNLPVCRSRSYKSVAFKWFDSTTAYRCIISKMTIIEMNVINAAKAWKRAKTPERRIHLEKMLGIAVDTLEAYESRSKRTSFPRKKKVNLRVVK